MIGPSSVDPPCSTEALVFVDTNVFLYRFDDVNPEKRQRATDWFKALWSEAAGRLSWQVVFEFYANATRKTKVAPGIARAAVNEMLEWEPELPCVSAIERAWYWCDQAQINFWDALIVASAEQAGCRWLLSEDFQAGRRFGGMTVLNPFENSPSELGLRIE
jgi:predicted nucleic acid-binding protein